MRCRGEEKMISLWHWILLEFDANRAALMISASRSQEKARYNKCI
jgi:hypothetical protein